jgi:hypothetical protein
MFYLLATCWQQALREAIPVRERERREHRKQKWLMLRSQTLLQQLTKKYPTKIGLGIPSG